MQSAGGSKILKEVVSEFKLLWKDVTTLLAALSVENVELKEHLREAIHLLCLFTSGQKNSRNSELLCSPQDGIDHTVCDDEVRDEGLVEEEFADI